MGVIIVLIGMLLSVNLSIALDELPCHFLDSINITDGNRLANDDSIEFNGLVYSRKQYAEINYVLLRDGTDQITVDPYIRGCICNIKPCVRLCCPLGTLNTDDTDITVCQDHDKGNKFEAEVIHKNNETKVIPLERFFAYIEGIPCNFVYFDDDYQITHKGEISRGNLSTKLTHQNSCLHAGLNAETNEVDLRLLTCIELEGDDYDLNQYHVIRHQIINFYILWYFYTPIGITLTINYVFFLLITLKIRKIQQDIAAERSQEDGSLMQKALNEKKETCILYLRLILVMGLIWIMEIVSYLMDNFSPLFLITDILNSLSGLFIFILFIVNRRVLRLIKERWQNLRGKATTNDNDTSNLISRSAAFMQMNPILTIK
ncbi:G-protein coupled receptor Mth-like isoform X2 [Sitodiplosis mosellana]|uniref:G-protein coupled receptor Mth-like isoform X2 n=1 Tax=Sitodiplosis mosellana TaxID=263140 RepID=UPI002444A613|nr:G-protein coupled receptor Mth-like isoform X2 [Sitodiplosis mosellana]